MADKPRVKAPKKRSTPKADTAADRRRLLVMAGGVATVLVVAVGAFLLLGAGGDSTSPDKAREALAAAGCTFKVAPALFNLPDHSDFPNPDAIDPMWNTDPPTSGRHYVETLIFGAYDEPVQLGRVLHNLEHGAVYILYGNKVPDSTVAQLKQFYDAHKNGTILAPYPKMGKQIALGAWLAEGLPEASSARGSGVLAKCTRFDQAAFDAFFGAFQFKGPESSLLRPQDLKPGDN